MPLKLKLKPKSDKKPSKPAKTPRTHKPVHMTLDEWQVALRREFGREQKFILEPADDDSPLGAFVLRNPETKRAYRLSIRGQHLGDNFCSCPDFRINTLGTCKHIEFALKEIAATRAGQRALEDGVRPAYSEIFLRFGAEREVVLRIGSDCPPASARALGDLVQPTGVLTPTGVDQIEWVIGRLQMNGHEVHVDEQAVEWVAQRRDAERLTRDVDQLFARGLNSPLFDDLVKAKLYPYQRQGILFLAKAGRALLADDMGLGKTLQSLGATEVLARVGSVQRVLVVTLTSLKHQWKSEIEKFTDRSATVISGTHTKRQNQFRSEDGFFKITSYQLLAADNQAIKDFAPDLIILDEAQRIKNWKTRTARVTKELQSQYAIVLTGTPLENRLEELHSIVQFVDRYRLGPLFRFLDKHQLTDDGGKVVGYTKLNEVAQTLEPVVLRRTKGEVLKQLPGRIDSQYFVPMTDQQRDIHDEYGEMVAKLVHKWRTYRFLSDADQKRLQAYLQNMRMVCNSTYLIDPATNHGNKINEITTRLSEILEDPTSKVVIFSQWVATHQLIAKELNEAGVKYEFLHGGVPGHKRGALIDRFKTDPDCRVFLSTDAGGIGLNLQAASFVIIADQPWSPALLEQRIARVHRMGQGKPVNVLHFITQGSIEEGILSTQKFKKGLFAGVLDGGSDTVRYEGGKLNHFMKTVERATHAAESLTPETSDNSNDAEQAGKETNTQASPSTTVPADALLQLATLGRDLLGDIVQSSGGSALPISVERDPQGKPTLKLSLGSDQTLAKVGQLFSTLAQMFQGK
jgi:superfamily II DNA or RNA helicase